MKTIIEVVKGFFGKVESPELLEKMNDIKVGDKKEVTKYFFVDVVVNTIPVKNKTQEFLVGDYGVIEEGGFVTVKEVVRRRIDVTGCEIAILDQKRFIRCPDNGCSIVNVTFCVGRAILDPAFARIECVDHPFADNNVAIVSICLSANNY